MVVVRSRFGATHTQLAAQRIWGANKDRFPFTTTTSATAARPDDLPAECQPHLSVVLRQGQRTWGFETQEALDAFKKHVEGGDSGKR